jgi:acyl-CoA dehydrogenase
VVQQLIVRQEESRYRSSFGIFEIGLGMCLPTLMAYGTEEHKARRIRPGLYGEEIWCQMFSEPAAGSDVAGVQTRARPEGQRWVVNGQKVWTTGAQFSDFGLLLARTDPTAPKHAGLTMFFVDMKSPGIEVRPIRQMDGDSEFNEVFLTDVRVPDDQRLGAVGAGWKVALTTLMHERLSVGAEIGLLNFEALWAVVKAAGRLDEPLAVEHLADAWVAEEGLRLHHCRSLTALSRGGTPGPEQSIAKLVKARLAQRMATFALQMRGEAGQVGDDDPTSDQYVVERTWTRAAAMRIAGGTDEILRNIIAERVLGLPEEARLDKGVPFNEIPR